MALTYFLIGAACGLTIGLVAFYGEYEIANKERTPCCRCRFYYYDRTTKKHYCGIDPQTYKSKDGCTKGEKIETK